MKWLTIFFILVLNIKTSQLNLNALVKLTDYIDQRINTHAPTPPDHAWTFTIVYDNYAYNPRLETDWGWSCLISRDSLNVLVDAGGRGDILISNLNYYQLTPESIDVVFITHRHLDHYGGLSHFNSGQPDIQYYVPFNFSNQQLDQLVMNSSQIHYLRDYTVITEQVFSTGLLGEEIPEQSVVVDTDSGLVLITGCSHPGLINIVEKVNDLFEQKIFLVMGGFHLTGQSDDVLLNLAQKLDSAGIKYVAPSHCSGDETRKIFKDYFKQRFIEVGVGFEITI
ncbi:MAG: MBL fold metallo-hydrolase [bacterium]